MEVLSHREHVGAPLERITPMRSANPALNAKTFDRHRTAASATETMTLEGTVARAGFLLLLIVGGAVFPWTAYAGGANPGAMVPYLVGGLLGGLVVAMICVFKPTTAPFTAPLYAGLEGLALGALSAILEVQFPGIVIQAVTLTFGVFACLLLAYQSGLIKATENFKLGVVAATGGIFLVYLVSFVGGFFGFQMPLIHSSGTFGILFSLFVVGIAALNLVLDFDFIEKGAESGAPKYMEWYGAFGLIVTLVWLYIEILHLLSKLRSR
jgi:uncharacterized YccA/Bax inhibitor family protein